MSDCPVLSVVIAVREGPANLPAWLEILDRGGRDAEVLFVCAGDVPDELRHGTVAAISCPEDTLIPSLWSRGIRMARGHGVALTTSQFIPDPEWLARLAEADLTRWVGVGGAIDNDPQASAANWAVFFLRYSAFMPPLAIGEAHEIAADNAIYRRTAIVAHSDLLAHGFWEPSFHRRFRAEGLKLCLNPSLVLVHRGTLTPQSFARQRRLHGRAYGIERAERSGLATNMVLLLTSPLVTPVLLARVVRRISRQPQYRTKLLRAFPWLLRFTFSWAAGETSGYAAVLARRMRRQQSIGA